MANRFWVGGTNTWNATATGKWSTTSGGASGAAVPTATDDVFFDVHSIGTVTIGSSVACQSITCTGFTGTLAGTSALAITNSLLLVSGMTFSYTGTITFNGTISSTITSAGKTLPNLLFNGSGGTWTLQDNLTLGSGKTLRVANDVTSGASFVANNHNVTVPGGVEVFLGNGCLFDCGTGTWTISAAVGTLGSPIVTNALWIFIPFFAAGGLSTTGVFSGRSATINFTGATSSSSSILHDASNIFGQYVNFDDGFVPINITGNGTASVLLDGEFSNINIIGKKSILVSANDGLFIEGFTATGTSGNLITIGSDTPGTQAFITYYGNDGDSLICDYLSLTDSSITGVSIVDQSTPITFTAYAGSHSIDNGDNTGWTFNSPSVGSVATWPSHAALSAVGHRLIKGVATWSPHTTVTMTGRSTHTSVLTVAPKVTLAAVGNGLIQHIVSWLAHGSLSAVGHKLANSVWSSAPKMTPALKGHAIANSVLTLAPKTTLSGVGRGVRAIVATWVAQTSLSAIGRKLLNSVLTSSPHSTLSNAGHAIANSVLTLAPKTTLSNAGHAIANSVLTLAPRVTLAGAGRAVKTMVATWLAHNNLTAIGTALHKGVATWSSHSALSLTGHATANVVWTSNPHSSLSLVGAAVRTGIATWLGHGSFGGTTQAAKSSVAVVGGKVFLTFGGRSFSSLVYPAPASGRGLNEFRRVVTTLEDLRATAPVLQSLQDVASELKDLRATAPVLQSTRKNPPSLR